MAHPNLQTNGASLEDCHTNFFALTDLCGIRWRKLTSEGYTPQPGNAGVYGQQGNPHQPVRGMPGGVTQPWDYLNDPVLSSYWRCLSNDILCVWRRIPASSVSSPAGNSAFPPSFPGGFPNPSTPQGSSMMNTLAGPKELWIFWYGDTSPDLTNLVVPEILSMEGEQGSWENGLSYECRSLLFKALHNLIERCLLSRDFVRLGKWFVQPQEGIDPACIQQLQEPAATGIPTKNNHLSFSFSFFVHGESTVCASIDVRQHPVVRRITQRHLAAAQASNGGIHVLLAPYGLAGVLTGTSYKASTDPTTRKLMDEWKQYYPVECANPNSSSQQRGPGPGGGFEATYETDDMVEVIVGKVRMRYPSFYVLVCDADSTTNSAAFNQLAASEGGMTMTPPASPVHTSHAATLTRSLSHSGSQASSQVSAQQHHPASASSSAAPSSGPLLPSVPCSTAAALTRLAQAAHSWRPEEAARLSEQAWQDTLLSPSGLCTAKLPDVGAASSAPAAPAATPAAAGTPEKETNLWDFQDPTVKHGCSCAKSRRNKTSSSSQGNGGNSSASISSAANLFGTTSSSAPSSMSATCSSSVSSSSSSSSSSTTTSSSVKRSTVPFHLRPLHAPAARSSAAGKDAVPAGATGLVDAGTQDRANRSVTPATSSASTTTAAPAPPPALPTYQRSQAALKGPSATTTSASSSSQQQQQQHSALNTSSNSVGPFLASPASVAPSPVPTPHSHAPPSVPPMDSSLTLPSPHPPASNEPASNFAASTPSAADGHHSSLDHASRATPSGAVHTPGGPKSNAAYSPYVAIPSVDTPGWPLSVGPAAPRSTATTTTTTSTSTAAPCSSLNASNNNSGADIPGFKKIVLPTKEYEQELKEEEGGPSLLYDYSTLNAWLFHPVKRANLNENPNVAASGRTQGGAGEQSGNSTNTTGHHVNGGIALDGENMDVNDYEDDPSGVNPRKRKEPDTSRDDDMSGGAAGAKQVNPNSLFTIEGLQPSYHDLDKIFDNSDDSNDAFPVPTPPGSNKPAGLPEDTALVPSKQSRIAPAHPSPGTTILAHTTNILASAEKMFPTPPSHEHPMQSPCGQLEHASELNSDISAVNQNGIKMEPGYNGYSPSYLPDDNKDWSYVYLPPTTWKMPTSSRYAPLTVLPSQTMSPLNLPAPYRPTNNSNQHPASAMPVEVARPPALPPSMRPFGRMPNAMGPPYFPRVPGPAPFSPISPSPFGMDGAGPPFGGPHGMPGHVPRPGMANFPQPPHNTLKQLLQHQQGHHPPAPFQQHVPPAGQLQMAPAAQVANQVQPQSPHLGLPECHSLVVTIVLGDSMLNVFRDHNFDSCSVCVCSDGQSWVGSIRGPDAFFYLPESKDKSAQKALPAPQQQQQQQQFPGMPGMGPGFMGQQSGNQEEESCPRCNCGFSALVNRRLAHQAGLFYEDEVEIAGAHLTQDPAQYKLGSLYALCHSSEKDEQVVLTRSRAIDFGLLDTERAVTAKATEKESDKDTMSSTIAAVVMEATAPTVDTLPVPLMDLLREQCLLLHHSSSPLFRAEQLQAASRKSAILHALDLSDSCDTARIALNLALYNNPPAMPLTSPMQQQGPPPPYQQAQQQNWGSAPSTPSTPYGMPFSPLSGPTFPTGGPGFQGNPPMHPPAMSPSLHSPNVPVRGRPSTPASASMMPMAMSSPVGMAVQRPLGSGQPGAPPPPASPLVHYWPFLHAAGPSSNHEVVKVMRHLQPLLQDSIQKKRAASLWRAPFAVQGPLTWRQFIQMAVRGTEDRCGPQPIPSILAGFDRDWVALAPLAVPHWDRLLLEPYSRPRDIAYIVVAPEVDYVLGKTKAFLKELSCMYEMCRFGKHVPYKGLRDGILRVGKSAASKLANEQHPIDEWFTNIGDSPVAQLLRLYARVCRYHLAPMLNFMQMDRTLLDPPQPPSARPAQPVPSPMAPPSTTPLHTSDYTGQIAMGPPNPTGTPFQNQGYGASQPPSGTVPTPPADGAPKPPASPKPEDGSGDQVPHPTSGAEPVDDDDSEPPSIVIYMVDPFSFGSDSLDLGRLTTLGLLRCYHQMMATVSETVQGHVSLQLISADSILQMGKDFTGAAHYDSMRALALNVFTQSKKVVPQPSNVKSLTGFGPAAAADTFIKGKDEKNRAAVRVYLPPYVLAPTKDRTLCDLEIGSASNNGSGVNSLSLYHRPDKYSVLYVSYCLSEDQRWLIAACTDERGEIVDSCTIGIDVPNRTKRKRASVRRFGLQRLMDFILGVISTGVHPWRLVIGRLGRMGHGELRGWSALLSRKNLLRVSRHLAEVCGQCSLMFTSQAPTLVSACLVSLEPDSHFRLMPDQFTIDERFGQHNCHLSTPEDATCTHILVFPTSATTRSPQTTFQEENINGPDLGDDDLLSALNDDMDDQFVDGISGFDDLFMTWPDPEQNADEPDNMMTDNTGGGGQSGGMNNMGSMGTSRSPGAALGGPSSPSGGGMRSNMAQSPSGMAGGSGRQSPRAEQEEVGTLLQQPLALGYYVSTAPTGEMPAWFWASCPHMARSCPAFLKCALHLHNHAAQQGSDDLLLQQQQQQQSNSSSKVHPLDSQVTTDVLRYVMEGYNALSWLAIDPKSRDRRSCLPIHIQLLVQLYHALSALV